MSLKTRAITAVFLSVILIGLAVLIWAYKSGKVTIFGSQFTTQGTVIINSQSEWKSGSTLDKTDLDANPGFLQLSKSTANSAKWTKLSGDGGPGSSGLNPVASSTAGNMSMLKVLSGLIANFNNTFTFQSGATFAYDGKEDKFLLITPVIHQIVGSSGLLQIWSFDPATSKWEEWPSAGICTGITSLTPPCGGQLVYNSKSKKTLLFGKPYSSGTTTTPASQQPNSYEVDWQAKKFTLINNPSADLDTGGFIFYNEKTDSYISYSQPYNQAGKISSINASDYSGTELFSSASAVATSYPHWFVNGEAYSTLNYDFTRVQSAMAAYDPEHNQIIMFGNETENISQTVTPCPPTRPGNCKKTDVDYLNETWSFDLSTKKWQMIDAGGTGVPAKRLNAQMVYDPDTKNIILFGGESPTGVIYGDTWVYNTTDATWTKITPQSTGDLIPRTKNLMVYNTKTKAMVSFGGTKDNAFAFFAANSPISTVFNEVVATPDLWSLSLSNYESTGTYTSTYGSSDISSFDGFTCGAMVVPDGTKITYQFSGSSDNVGFSAFSEEKMCENGRIDIKGLKLIPDNSKWIKTRINLTTTNSSNTPTVDSYAIDYTTNGVLPPTPSPTPSGTNPPSNPPTNPGKLVSTGAVLWFNILIAIIVAGILSFILLRKESDKK